jgi:hypothetical protein
MKIELLNSEGPILVGESVNKDGVTRFILSFGSRKKNPLELSKKELIGFIAGDFVIEDPEGDLIKYTELSDGMKPKPSDLEAFINS